MHLDTTINTGQLIQTLTFLGVVVGFLLRKYFKRESDGSVLAQHTSLLEASAKAQADINTVQAKQQTFIEGLDKRLNTVEERQWDAHSRK